MKKATITFSFIVCRVLLSFGANTSYIENFDAGLPASWFSTSQYNLSVQNGELNMSVQKNTKWSQFVVALPEPLDLTANPYISVKARVTNAVRLLVYLVDEAQKSYLSHARILYSENGYSHILIDMSGYASAIADKKVDITNITKLYIGVNGDAIKWEGNVWLDEIRVGDAAVKKATVGGVKNQTYYQGTTSNELLLTDIYNASNIIVEGANSLVENPTISPLGGSAFKLTFDAKSHVSGLEAVKIISVPNANYLADTATFNLTIEKNLPPTAFIHSSLDAKTNVPLNFSITNIRNGNTNVMQKMNFTLNKISGTSINIQSAVYDTLAAKINVSGQALTTGATTYKFVLKDDGGIADDATDSLVSTITINAYTNYNMAPTFQVPANKSVLLSQGAANIELLNLTDGNHSTIQESLTASVTSNSNPSVASATVINIDGNPSHPALVLTPIVLGTTQIEVTVADDGAEYDNGAKQTVKTIAVTVKADPVTGYTVNLANFDAEKATNKWKIESDGSGQTVTADNFGEQSCLKIVGSNKGQFTGMWYRNPELDLTNHPYLSYEVYVVDNPIQTHVYLWDNFGQRNVSGAESERKTIPANTWTACFMDFRGLSKMIDKNNQPINAAAIDSLLFNYNSSFTYPFTNWTGTMYIRNIKIGSDVPNVPAIIPAVTADNPGNKSYYRNAGIQKITITGISCGAHCDVIPTVMLKSNSNASLLSNVALSALYNDSIDIDFGVGATTGNTIISLDITAEGSTTTTLTFAIYVTNDVAAYAFNVDATTQNQVIAGFGGNPKSQFLEQFKSTGATVIRLFPNGDDIEPINDNSSATTLDRSKFLDSGLKVDYIKAAMGAGIKDFVLTLLSPPAWMKQNLSSTWAQSTTQTWANTSNKVDPIYYDEYVEFLVACVQLIKERTGVELMGICPQNEPAFSQPYGSAILDPVNYAKICGLLGKRLSDMGYKTKVINSEQVFSQGFYPITDYIAAVRADADANQYTSVIGMHYPSNTKGTLLAHYTAASASPYPKEYWGMEMVAQGNDWSKAISEMQTMTTALNNGVGLWLIYGWNGAPLLTNSINAVGSEVSMTYGAFATRHFYAVKNIFNHFKPGSHMVGSNITPSTNSNLGMAANLNTVDSVLSIVLTNSGTTNVVGSLPANVSLSDANIVRTSEYEFYQKVNPVLDGKILLPAKSITTISVSIAKVSQEPNAISTVVVNNENDFSLYPNPTKNQFKVMAKHTGNFSVTIIDLMGRSLIAKSNQHIGRPVDVSELKSGIYNVMIKADKVYVEKLVIQ